jgi:hypothetical protein
MQRNHDTLVASAILADVEPGFQPGGKNLASSGRHGIARIFRVGGVFSGRLEAALYGRQEACRHNFSFKTNL